MNDSPAHPVIVMGASAGGVNAILALAPQLPADFPAPILFVQHIGAHRTELWNLVSASGPNPAVPATQGCVPRPGTIYIAPPDQHMLLDKGAIRLSAGPKEHHARPAIDPLFRSAALSLGPRAIGVVLTGMLDDGSAGLRAIKACGGTAVVQEPADAFAPSMPEAALACVQADHVVPLASLGALLHALALRPVPRTPVQAPQALVQAHAVSLGEHSMRDMYRIGQPSAFTCPDCSGVLFELNDKPPLRYLCHTGHAFSLRSLAYAQQEVSATALWSGLRALREKEAALRRMAEVDALQNPVRAQQALHEANELAAVCVTLRRLTENTPSHGNYDVMG